MSKPRYNIAFGISKKVTCLLFLRHPAYRWHELNTGFYMERENLSTGCKGKISSWCTSKIERTEASHGGGTSRSSEEVLVMRMERRGCIIWPTRSGEKLLRQEISKEYRQNIGSRTGPVY